MKLHAEVEEFLRLHERVKAGVASEAERARWEALKAQVMERQKKSGTDGETPSATGRRRLSRTG